MANVNNRLELSVLTSLSFNLPFYVLNFKYLLTLHLLTSLAVSTRLYVAFALVW